MYFVLRQKQAKRLLFSMKILQVVLYYLCKRIVDLENAGYLVCGVTELNPDGSHPKVAFRNTKEYKRAKKEYKL